MKKLTPFPGFPEGAERRRSHYESLARAIVYQQVTGKAASTIFKRVSALTPTARFPTADEIGRLTDAKLRGAGLSRQKTAAVRDLAAHCAQGKLKLRSLGRAPDDEVIEQLVQVRGIGVWSAQMFLLFKLGRLDVLPTGDLGVQEGIKVMRSLRERPGEKKVAELAACWSPLSSVGAWYAWRAAEAARPAPKR